MFVALLVGLAITLLLVSFDLRKYGTPHSWTFYGFMTVIYAAYLGLFLYLVGHEEGMSRAIAVVFTVLWFLAWFKAPQPVNVIDSRSHTPPARLR